MRRNAGRISLGLMLVAGLYCLLIHLLSPIEPHDDAYITFRYVENFVSGRGLVYNEGEYVFGVSTPLYAIWLIVLKTALPGASLPVLAVRGNALLLLLAAWFAYRFLRAMDMGVIASSLTGAALLATDVVLRNSLGGMESSLFILLGLAAALATLRKNDLVAVLCGSLAALTRPEGLFLLGIVLVIWLLEYREEEWNWRPVAGLLPLVGWILVASLYFGTPIPHSLVAKAQPLYPLDAGIAFSEIARNISDWSLGGPLRLAGYRPLPGWPAKGAGLVMLVWALWPWIRNRGVGLRRLVIPGFCVLLVAFYGIVNPMMMPWYIPPIYALWLVSIVGACVWYGRGQGMKRVPAGIAVVLIGATILASLLLQVRSPRHKFLEQGATLESRDLVLDAYRRAAAWVDRDSSPTDTVVTPEIGLIGYELHRRISDSCGLVSPEAVPFNPSVVRKIGGGGTVVISAEFIRQTEPEYILALTQFLDPGMLANDWFKRRYALAHKVPLEEGGPDLPDDFDLWARIVARALRRGGPELARFRTVLIFRRQDA